MNFGKIVCVMKTFLRNKIVLAALTACVAVGTVSAEDDEEGKPIGGTLEGYFVRVKSELSGEKELYYNKDGTLRSSSEDGLLGGDFSLDESLFSGGDDLDLSFSPETTASPKKDAVPAKKPMPTPLVPAEDSEERPAASQVVSRLSATKFVEDDGVDEHSILRRFSREKRDFGINEATYKKILNKEATDHFTEAYSLKNWQGATSYGIRRYSSEREGYEMRSAGFDTDSITMGRFDTTSSIAGERMFVRNSEGLLEVRLTDRFKGLSKNSTKGAITVRETSGFSMQDINRYQFRRNRSTEAGLPVTSPGSDGEVRTENFGNRKK